MGSLKNFLISLLGKLKVSNSTFSFNMVYKSAGLDSALRSGQANSSMHPQGPCKICPTPPLLETPFLRVQRL